MKKHLIIITSLIIFVDQLAKFIISNKLLLNHPIPVIGNSLSLTLTHNTGATFGILKGHNTLFLVLSLLIAIFLIYWLCKSKDINEQLFLALILAGSIGNLIDRIVFGYVIDFIDFKIWPIFNIADASVTLGAVALIAYYLLLQSK